MGVADTIEILGVQLHLLTSSQLVQAIAGWAGEEHKRVVAHVNTHAINLAYANERFRATLNGADLVFCDGYGVAWAARRKGYPVPERLGISDWIDELAATLAAHDFSLFLLGDEDGVAELAAQALRRRHPGLRVVGAHHGFFAKQGAENDRVIRKINDSGADVLMVGLGMPAQEFWIEDNLGELGARVFMPVGATYRWYAGIERRAPKWMADRGLEWMGRLFWHPVRMFRRYVVGNPAFVWRILHADRRAPSGVE